MLILYRIVAATLIFPTVYLAPPAHAARTTTTSITCSSTKTLQAKIDAIAPGTIGKIYVKGTCTENIHVPAGKFIQLIGGVADRGATITPKDASDLAVYNQGLLQIENMTIRSSNGSAQALMKTDNGGTLYLLAGLATTSSARQVLVAANNSTLIIANSRVTNTGDAATQDKVITVDKSSSLNVQGSSGLSNGPGGTPTTVISGSNDAIYCGGNSSAMILTEGTGSVTIENGLTGLNLNSCSLTLDNQTSTAANLTVRNASNGGIVAYNSDLMIKSATIASNRYGIYSMQSRTVIVGAVFGGTLGANTTDIKVDVGSTVDIDDFGGQTSFPNIGPSSFVCVNGGQVFYYRPFVSQDLTSYEGDCLKAAVY